MNIKAAISILLIVGSVSMTAFAEENSCEPMTFAPDYSLLHDCKNQVNLIFPGTSQEVADEVCNGKGIPFTKCLTDIEEKAYAYKRAANGGVIFDGFDCPMYDRKVIKPQTAAYICNQGTSDEYTSCVAELFRMGGLPFYSSKLPNGVALCRGGTRKDLNACIIEKYQSRRYTGAQAAIECANRLGLSHLVGTTSTTTQTSDADARAAREAYNRAQAERRAAEAKKQQQQQPQTPKQSEQKKTPAPGSSSSGSVIEDLPTL